VGYEEEMKKYIFHLSRYRKRSFENKRVEVLADSFLEAISSVKVEFPYFEINMAWPEWR